jgi:hypothetical protein
MKLVTLTQPPAGPQVPSVPVQAPVNQIAFVFKQPLQPVFMTALGDNIVPCIGDYDALLDELKDTHVVLETVEGQKCAVNPDKIAFFFPTEIGQFSLVFTVSQPGQAGMAGLTVKATTAEIEGMFANPSSPIILG